MWPLVRVTTGSAAVLDTLAVVEYMNEQYKQAERSVERALLLSPNEPSMLYHRAMVTAALGETTSAIRMLDELLQGGDEFAERSDADALLVALKE